MSKQYSAEFKEQAVKRVLGINVNSLYSWKSRYQKHPEQPFVGSDNLRDADAELRRLQKEVRDLKCCSAN